MSWQFEEFMIFVAKEKNAFPWPDNILKFTSDVFDHSYQMANISMINVWVCNCKQGGRQPLVRYLKFMT